MGYEKVKFVTEAAAPIDVYRGIRYAMWKLRRNMWGRLKKNRLVETAITLRNESVNKPQRTFYDINAKTKWRRHGKMVRSREHAPPQDDPDPGCLVHASVAGGCDEWQGFGPAKSDTRKLIESTELSP